MVCSLLSWSWVTAEVWHSAEGSYRQGKRKQWYTTEYCRIVEVPLVQLVWRIWSSTSMRKDPIGGNAERCPAHTAACLPSGSPGSKPWREHRGLSLLTETRVVGALKGAEFLLLHLFLSLDLSSCCLLSRSRDGSHSNCSFSGFAHVPKLKNKSLCFELIALPLNQSPWSGDWHMLIGFEPWFQEPWHWKEEGKITVVGWGQSRGTPRTPEGSNFKHAWLLHKEGGGQARPPGTCSVGRLRSSMVGKAKRAPCIGPDCVLDTESLLFILILTRKFGRGTAILKDISSQRAWAIA